ncbi:SDR family NAD(P)-dependent oxidoreductase, partial [Pseudomonadales bacterium]|nr:SDR family NAD(P)-dependent oxidoreductase [Pseudomonadales bacterium]
HCHLAVCDLTSRDDCAALSEELLQTHGAVDVLCNIAGGFQMGETVFETLDETWDFLFNLNTKSIIYMTQKIVPAMVAAGCGKVVNVGAVAATQGQAHMGAYLASKSATIRLTESLAEEVKQAGVNVNCVLPAVIDTPRNRSDMPDADFGQWVAPEHLAAVIGFLASAEAIAVHGAAVPVRGLGG